MFSVFCGQLKFFMSNFNGLKIRLKNRQIDQIV